MTKPVLLNASAATSAAWASEGFFPRGAKTGEVSFFPIETKKTTFFAKSLIRKCQISKCGGPPFPAPTPIFGSL